MAIKGINHGANYNNKQKEKPNQTAMETNKITASNIKQEPIETPAITTSVNLNSAGVASATG